MYVYHLRPSLIWEKLIVYNMESGLVELVDNPESIVYQDFVQSRYLIQ